MVSSRSTDASQLSRGQTPSTASLDGELVLVQQRLDLIEAIQMPRRQQQAQCWHLHVRPQISRDDDVLFTTMRAPGHEHRRPTNPEVVPQLCSSAGLSGLRGRSYLILPVILDARRLGADGDDAFGIQIWSAC